MAQVDTNNPNDPNNPNNQPNQVNQPGQVNQPATTGGAGAVTTTGAGNVTGQVVGTNNPAQPFQNIASYLKANEQGGKDLTTQVAGTVSAPIDQASAGITNAANTFTGQVNAGYTPENKELISAVGTNPAYVVAENPENVTNFQKQLGNKYTGPSDFTQMPGYGDLQTAIANAQAQANNTQNESGIQTLLKGVEGPTTAGINKLDSLLLSANPENYQKIQEAGAGAANLLPTLQSTTAAQNELAGKGATEASTSAADAAAALQAALTGERGNLGDQTSTIQGIIDEYNKSVGIINPVTTNIGSAIQNFLAANPNLKPTDINSILAPLMNLAPVNTPDMGTYASPYDYQTVAALKQLGLSPDDLATLGINPDQANLAQTFNVPGELQNAVGQAPGVEKALQDALSGLGGQITGAYQPYQDLIDKEMDRANLVTTAGTLQTQIKQDTQTVANLQAQMANPPKGVVDPNIKQQLADAQAKLDSEKAQYQSITTNPNYVIPNYWPQIGQMAQGLQWLDPASKGYNELIQQINAELGKLGDVGVPTLNYHPTTLTDPVTGVPLGQVAAQDFGKIANAGLIGTAGAGAVGAGAADAAAIEAANVALGQTGEGLATSGAPGAYEAANVGAGLGNLATTLPAAGIAAYGTKNIVQNIAAKPIERGLMTLGNTLFLGPLSLPPEILNKLGAGLKNVINSIGDFFGGLF